MATIKGTIDSQRARRQFLAARQTMAAVSADNAHQVRRVYLKAARQAGAVLQANLDRNATSLTTDRWQLIQSLLREEANRLGVQIDELNRGAVRRVSRNFIRNATQQMQQSGLVGVRSINNRSLQGIGIAVNNRVIHNMASRMVGGMNYSTRIWKLGADWINDVRGVTASGIAAGRDPRKIARDLSTYTRHGKMRYLRDSGVVEARSWGPHMRAGKIPKNIDYRALRLVRSELYASIQDAQLQAGRANPANNGLYNWINNPARLDWDCPCEEYEKGSPYEYDKVPAYPHPNCMCAIEPLMRDEDEFFEDLLRWDRGESVDYLDDWYNTFYLPNEGGASPPGAAAVARAR